MKQDVHKLTRGSAALIEALTLELHPLVLTGFPSLAPQDTRQLLYDASADMNLVRVYREAGGRAVGLVELKRQEITTDGRTYTVFRSLAVVEPSFRGRLSISRDLQIQTLKHALFHPFTTAVVFELSTLYSYHAAAHKIYRVYPNWRGEIPPRWEKLLRAILDRWVIPSEERPTENPYVFLNPSFVLAGDSEGWARRAACQEAIAYFRAQTGGRPEACLAMLAPVTLSNLVGSNWKNAFFLARRMGRRFRGGSGRFG